MLDRSDLLQKHFGTDDPEEVSRLLFQDSLLAGEDLPAEELTKMTFPYYAPDDSLPPIPTPKEIEEAGKLACNQQAIYNWGRHHSPTAVFRVKSVYAVKMGLFSEFLQVSTFPEQRKSAHKEIFRRPRI